MKPEITTPDPLPPTANSPRPVEPVSGCADLIIMIILGGGIALMVFLRHVITLSSTFAPDGAPRVAALIGVGVQFVILSALLIPLAVFWPSSRRRTYQAWLAAHVLTMFLAIGFFFPFTAIYWQAAFHILIGLVCLPALFLIHAWFLKLKKTASEQAQPAPLIPEKSPRNTGILWLSAAIVAAFSSYPWLLNGALGSVMDTLLMTLTGLIYGMCAAVVFWLFFARRDQQAPPSKAVYLLDAFGYSVFLLLLAGGLSFCFGGVQLLAMISLPPAGFLIVFFSALLGSNPSSEPEGAGLMATLRGAAPLAVITGLLMSYPLVFFDPDELILVLSDSASEVLAKAFQAALFTALIILAFTLIVALGLALRSRRPSTPPAAGENGRKGLVYASLLLLFAIGLGAGVILYLTSGQPGFYGDQYFVIMKDQADLTGFSQMDDYQERRQGVYERLVSQSNQSQADIRATLDRFSIHYTPYYLVNGLEVDGNVLVKLWLSTRPEVDRILENPVLRPLPGPVPPSGGPLNSPGALWNLSLIQADRVWNELGVRGQGIVIGQSDSGVQGDHPELYDSYRGRTSGNDYNWLDPWNHSPAPVDIGGHGTHTLGTILGNTTGVAPDAEWIACVNLARNLGSPARYLDCMQFSFAPYPQTGDPLKDGDPSKGAHILNNSWGCPEIEGCDAEVFHPAVRALREAGVFVVGSAGNDGPKCGSLNVPPPIYAEVFAVGAIDRSSNLAFFSSIGPVSADQSGRVKPDLVAPGVQVLSSLPLSTYGEFSGTSMAGPHVVGVVALMWSANPALIGDIDTTEQILIESADPYQGALPDCPGAEQTPSTAVGYGMLNAYNAVQMALRR